MKFDLDNLSIEFRANDQRAYVRVETDTDIIYISIPGTVLLTFFEQLNRVMEQSANVIATSPPSGAIPE